MNAITRIPALPDLRSTNPLGFSDNALSIMASDDAEFERSARRRGYLEAGECFGFRVISRNLRHGSPTSDGPIFGTRIEALTDAYSATTEGFIFERIERVRTTLASIGTAQVAA